MKLLALTAWCALSVTASAGSFFQQAASFSGSVGSSYQPKVPGNNPLEFCGDVSEHLLEITSLNVVPNPPVKGQTLNMEATGILKDVVTQGSSVDVTVKFGMITLLRKNFDLCSNAGQVDLECPVDSGTKVLKKAVDLPSQIPPGTYTVSANAYTKDGRSITCVTSTITFS